MNKTYEIFNELQNTFTIFVVEQRFALNRGYDYISSYKNSDHYIKSESDINTRMTKLMRWIEKKIPCATELVSLYIKHKIPTKASDITQVITALTKLFGLTEHQAAGPDILDPIIIEEGNISPKTISKIITLHKSSPIRPVIIIILKDNNFERAKELLKLCPSGINVKMIRNSGEDEHYKVINTGAENIDEFLDSYSSQCFCTCSNTPRNVLLNEEWAEKSIIKLYSPTIFKIRSNLIYEMKGNAAEDIEYLISMLQLVVDENDTDSKLIGSFLCMLKLFKVFCYDFGGEDIIEALSLAKSLENEILLAHVYRYANYFTTLDSNKKTLMLEEAINIFHRNDIEDHSIYAKNNLLVNQFYKDSIDVRAFRTMQQNAIYNTPGLVGMSIIYNNTGVAHLYTGAPELAIEYFIKGQIYSRDHIAQHLGLKTNLLIAKTYNFDEVKENEIRQVMQLCFDNLGIDRIPFIAATCVLNLLSVTLKKHSDLVFTLVEEYPITQLINNALRPGSLGISSLKLHIGILKLKYPQFQFYKRAIDANIPDSEGIRKTFIINNQMNPMIFNAWL